MKLQRRPHDFPFTNPLRLIALSLFSLALPACQGPTEDANQGAEKSEKNEEKEDGGSSQPSEKDTQDNEKPESDQEDSDGSKDGEQPEKDEGSPDSEAEKDPDNGETSGSGGAEEPGTEDDKSNTSSTGDETGTASTTGEDEDPSTGSTTADSGDKENQDSGDSTDDTGPEDPEPAPADEIQLFMSVDWEGVELESGNIRDMERFRRDFPEIPMTHYLNAAYYTKPRANASLINRQVKRTLLDIDELGLHIHGWKMLFEAAGVRYRSSPVFFGEVFVDKVGDAGHNIDIGSYSTAQLRKVIAFSINTLEKNGFGRAKSFRSGGWMSRRSVLEALTAEGIVRDASDVATKHFIDDPWHNSPLFRWLSQQLWPNTTFASQPYYMETAHGPLLQIPDNGALADYVTGQEMLRVYQACLDYKKAHPEQHVTMSFGFHTESATRFLGRVREGLKLIYAQAKRDKINVVARTSADLKVSAK